MSHSRNIQKQVCQPAKQQKNQSTGVRRDEDGLYYPPGFVRETASNKRHYQFLLTNVKTYDELHKDCREDIDRNETKYVVHSLRLHWDKGDTIDTTYNLEEDVIYGARFEEISPGLLNGKSSREHRRYQYTTHGHLTKLGQRGYFENIITLYNRINLNEKLATVRENIHTEPIDLKNHGWTVFQLEAYYDRLKQELGGYGPCITMGLSPNGKRFIYEYTFYLNEKFEIVDPPSPTKDYKRSYVNEHVSDELVSEGKAC